MGSMVNAVHWIQDHQCVIRTEGHTVQVQAGVYVGEGLTLAQAVESLIDKLEEHGERALPRTQIVIPSEGEQEICEALEEAKDALVFASRKLALFEDEDSSSRIYEAADTVRDVFLAWGGEE